MKMTGVKAMFILGISCFYHDAAAALLQDGLLVAAAEEERFSRRKHDSDFPGQAIDFCLRQAGITIEEVDYVVFYEKPLLKFERLLKSSLATFPRSWRVFSEAMLTWLGDKLWLKAIIQRETGVAPDKILFVDHHLSHAASAFFASPFAEAAVLTIDGVGEWTTTAKGYGKASWENGDQNELRLTHEQRFPHSLGLLYSAFTAFLGFRVNSGEYKVMGMSPYGQPHYLDKMEKLLTCYDDGSFWLDMDYFSYHYSPDRTISPKFIQLFGPPRRPESDFFTATTHPELNPADPLVKQNQYYADVAATIQRTTEEVILKLARSAHADTGSRQLCLAGGVGLNSKANGRLLNETPFEEIYIQPAAGDSGGALGAALYLYHVVLGRPRRFVQEHNYWGAAYDDATIRQAIADRDATYEQIENETRLTQTVVDDLLAGKVIAWYQGRFEWGPRALGSRSILADPRREEMKEIVNTKIKFREPFRPFAPVIPEEDVPTYFDLPTPDIYPLRFMLWVAPFTEKGAEVPAVNHFGTGRLQTVRRAWNARYYDVVKGFGEATGVPIVMNTSFNLRGEPIVNTPAQALNTFYNSEMDTLVMGNHIVRKA
jgi:carbamoyltransferase